MTSIILFIMTLSGLHLRVTEDEEDRGIDPSEIGYFAYDYINQDSEIRIVEQDESVRSLLANPSSGSLLS